MDTKVIYIVGAAILAIGGTIFSTILAIKTSVEDNEKQTKIDNVNERLLNKQEELELSQKESIDALKRLDEYNNILTAKNDEINRKNDKIIELSGVINRNITKVERANKRKTYLELIQINNAVSDQMNTSFGNGNTEFIKMKFLVLRKNAENALGNSLIISSEEAYLLWHWFLTKINFNEIFIANPHMGIGFPIDNGEIVDENESTIYFNTDLKNAFNKVEIETQKLLKDNRGLLSTQE